MLCYTCAILYIVSSFVNAVHAFIRTLTSTMLFQVQASRSLGKSEHSTETYQGNVIVVYLSVYCVFLEDIHQLIVMQPLQLFNFVIP